MGDVEIVGGPPRFAREDIERVVAAACRRNGQKPASDLARCQREVRPSSAIQCSR